MDSDTTENPLLVDLREARGRVGDDLDYVVVTLPTRGYFYDADKVVSEKDALELKVYPLSIVEETLISDPLLMINGYAQNELIKRAAPDITDIHLLSAIDYQVILIATRLKSRGKKMKVDMVCQHCEHENKIEVDLEQHLVQYSPMTDEELEAYSFELEGIGQIVHTRPISYVDSIELIKKVLQQNEVFASLDITIGSILNNKEDVEKYGEALKNIAKSDAEIVAGNIRSVSTTTGISVSNREHIEQWVDALPTYMLKEILGKIIELQESYMKRGTVRFQCSECAKENDVVLEVDPQRFFMPVEPEVTQTSSSKQSETTKPAKKKPTNRLHK